MRIGIGGFFQETNDFSNTLVTPEVLKRRWEEGQELIENNTGVRTYCGGIIDESKELGVELVPTLMSGAAPCGRFTKEAYEIAKNGLVERLWKAHTENPLDAIVLSLHGACVADQYPDTEGTLLQEIRAKFGPDIPIGAVLDLHANMTETMIANADALFGIKCYPHTDQYETSRKLVKTIVEMVQRGYRLYTSIVRLPWLISPAEGVTLSGPACDVMRVCLEQEQKKQDLIHATFYHGFPYADIPEASVTVVAVAKTQKAAEESALSIAQYAWSHRKDLAVPINSAEKAVDLALAVDGGGPVVINESSDNTGGGAPGDGTHLLRELLKRNLPGTTIGAIYDPEVAELAAKAGVGAKISCKLGGKVDNLHGEPVEITDAYVKCVCDGEHINHSTMLQGSVIHMGLSAWLRVGNVDVVVGSARYQPLDDGVFRMVGIEYDQMRIVAFKSSQHFKAWWTERVQAIVPCDSPGIQCADLSVLEFKNTNTSYYPLQDAQWEREE